MRRLRELEHENSQLNKIVAALTLDRIHPVRAAVLCPFRRKPRYVAIVSARHAVPGLELIEPCGGVIGAAGYDIGKPWPRIDFVEPGCLDQGVDDAGVLSPAVRATEKPSLAAERNATQRALDGVVADADATVIKVASEKASQRFSM